MFNIRYTKNKEKTKYSTKNNNSDGHPVFLATKNQIKASTSSRRNFRLNAAIRCMVRLAGSFPSPFRKIRSEIYDMVKKQAVSISSSLIWRVLPEMVIRTDPKPAIKAVKMIKDKILFPGVTTAKVSPDKIFYCSINACEYSEQG